MISLEFSDYLMIVRRRLTLIVSTRAEKLSSHRHCNRCNSLQFHLRLVPSLQSNQLISRFHGHDIVYFLDIVALLCS